MTQNSCPPESELTLYSSGDLPDDRMTAVSDHLASCTECAGNLESIRRLLASLPQLESSLSDVDKALFTSRVLDAAASKKTGRWRLVWGTAAAAVVTGFLVLLVIQPGTRAVDEPDLTNLQFAELDLVEEIDMLEDLELLELMELLQLLEEQGT